MSFTPGRLPGGKACGAQCVDFIVADGEIGFGSALAYLLARKRIGDRDVPVLLTSPGGYLVGATNLGRMWRKLGVTVVVARADAKPCGRRGVAACDADDEAAGVKIFEIVPGKAECASACPFALAGAVKRIAPTPQSIGVHESYIDAEEGIGRAVDRMLTAEQKAEARRDTEKELADFAVEMGVDAELARRSMKTKSEDMDWLSSDDVDRYRIAPDDVSLLPASLVAALSRSPPPEASRKTFPASRASKTGSGAFTKRQRP